MRVLGPGCSNPLPERDLPTRTRSAGTADAEVAEVPFTAFTSRRKAEHLSRRLIVRRVRRLNPHAGSSPSAGSAAGAEQGELFAAYRYHAVFTDSQLSILVAERTDRAHAIIEQVIADLKNGPIAHLPSGRFTANAAWLALARAGSRWLAIAIAIAINPTWAAGCLASNLHARATTGTLRTRLIAVSGRLARSGRRRVLHLPQHRPGSRRSSS